MGISRRTAAVFLLIVQAGAGYLKAGEPIIWEPVRGADHYRVEIRRDGKLVMETRSDEARLPPFLPTGLYEIRVHVINPFGGTASSSDWSELTVSVPSPPFIVDFSPREVFEGYAGETYDFFSHVTGVSLKKEDKPVFFLEDSSGKRADLQIQTMNVRSDGEFNDTELELNLGDAKLAAGEWALVMSGGLGQEARMEGALRVRKALKPHIRTIEPRQAPAGTSLSPLALQVDGFERGAELHFEGPSAIRTSLLSENGDGGRLLYTLDLAEAKPGWYTISINNPSGISAVRKRAFRVLPPKAPVPVPDAADTADTADAADTDDAAAAADQEAAGAAGEYSRSVLGGYALSLVPGDSRQYFNDGFLAFNLGFSADFRHAAIRKIPALRGLGWEVILSQASNTATYPFVKLNVFQLHLTFGLRYLTPFNFPLNFLLRTAGGIGFSMHSSENLERDTNIGGFTIKDLDSMDFTLRFGAGVRWDITSRFFADFTADVSSVLYLSRAVWFVKPRIDLGFAW